MSANAHAQSQVDFLKGEPHRKHPGVTNLKTLRLPEELQTAAQSILHSRLRYECGHQFSWYLEISQNAVRLFNLSPCRRSGDPAGRPQSQPHKLPVEPKTSGRGFDSEEERCEPGEGTLGESDGEDRRWVTHESNNSDVWTHDNCKEIIWCSSWRKANVLLVADIDEEALEDRIRKKVFSELRRTIYHWTPMK